VTSPPRTLKLGVSETAAFVLAREKDVTDLCTNKINNSEDNEKLNNLHPNE
jgi:hypothetical protein